MGVHDLDVLWQKDAYFFKWRLFSESFTPTHESTLEKVKLVQLALKMFMATYNREQPAHTSDTNRRILYEMKAFRKTVLRPAKQLIKEDIRNLNLLSLSDEVTAENKFDIQEPSMKAHEAAATQKTNLENLPKDNKTREEHSILADAS